jgi:beta-glucan synthesis-associated protein KRE6
VYKAFDEVKKEFYVDRKYIQSGMLQSWNKFCFIGGAVEFSAKLPGDPRKGGLWPARKSCSQESVRPCLLPHRRRNLFISHFASVWMLGNLARASYVGSSDFVWPYSYNKCDSRNRKSQEINACSLVNHYGLDSFTGRGSPEIDVLESMQGEAGELPNTFIQRPYQSTSLQVAPGVEVDRPVLGKRPNPVIFIDCVCHAAVVYVSLISFVDTAALVHRYGVLKEEHIRPKPILLRSDSCS